MTDASATVVQASALTRRFGARRAVEGVEFELRSGEALALFGPNGAGKTTLLRLLAGLLKPTSGGASVFGEALPGGPAVRARIGMIGHSTMLYSSLTALENIEFAARLHGLASPTMAAREVLERMQLSDRAKTPVRTLSRGMQQRVAIARATVHLPGLLLCDEPFAALDDPGAVALGAYLRTLRAHGAALVLVTHDIAQGLEHATHAGIMSGGRLLGVESCSGIDPAQYSARYRTLSAAANAA